MTSSKIRSAPWRFVISADRLEVARPRRDDAHVGRERLEDERGDLAGMAPERLLERRGVVVRDDDRQRGDLVRDAGTAGDPERRDTRAGRHEESVAVAVVSALDLHDALASRRARARGGPRSSSPRCPELTNRTISIDGTIRVIALGEPDLELRGRAEGGPAPRGARERALHGGGGWPKRCGPYDMT